jgi:hypothetical protein
MQQYIFVQSFKLQCILCIEKKKVKTIVASVIVCRQQESITAMCYS